MKHHYDLIVIGGGPMGIATAIEAKKNQLSCLILEKGVLVNSLYHFPDQMTFFSTSKRLEIGDVPFMSLHDKPTRNESLEYYRRVVEKWDINIHFYEPVTEVQTKEDGFVVTTPKHSYTTDFVVVATGFYSTPNKLGAKNEDLPKISHYYKNAHPFLGQRVAVVGAGNSAAQVALDLFHKDISVDMIIRGPELKSTIKYWIRPNIENRIEEGSIRAFYNTTIEEVKPKSIVLTTPEGSKEIQNDFVLAMIGYQPDYQFLQSIGITNCNDTFKTPTYDVQQETNINNIYLAGVVCGGLKTNRFMIEDSMDHAHQIIQDILRKKAMVL